MQQSGSKIVTTAFVALVAGFVAASSVVGVAAVGTAGGSSTPELTPGTELSACQTIDEAGIYQLTSNITTAPSDGCFEVTADDVSIHGNGHTVATENGTGAAVSADGVAGVSVTSFVLEGWQTGVDFDDVDSGSVASTTFRNVSTVAVSVTAGTSDVRVTDNTIVNSTAGVTVAGHGEGNAVGANTVTNVSGTAVTVEASDTDVVNNDIQHASGGGVRVTNTHSVLVSGNTISTSIGGVVVEDAGAVTVSDNEFVDSQHHAIQVTGDAPNRTAEQQTASVGFHLPAFATSGFDGLVFGAPEIDTAGLGGEFGPQAPVQAWNSTNHVANNTVSLTEGHGVLVHSTASVTVSGNDLANNRDGVHVALSTDVTVDANNVTDHRDDGIHLANASGNVVRENNVSENDNDGLYAVGDNNTIANNTAHRNGDDGVDVQNATGVLVEGNVVTENGNDGIYFREVHNSTMASNVAGENGDDGIDLRGSTNNLVVSNEVYWNDHRQLIVRTGSSGNTLENNTN